MSHQARGCVPVHNRHAAGIPGGDVAVEHRGVLKREFETVHAAGVPQIQVLIEH